MAEYFIVAHSFAAPFCSDRSEHYVEGESPRSALSEFAGSYKHPCGLYSANLYASHKDSQTGTPLAEWRCNYEVAMNEATKDREAYSLRNIDRNHFSVDGVLHTVKDPRAGRITRSAP